MNTKERAIREGAKLLGLMDGDDWSLRIWENLGWHYGVSNGCLSVLQSSSGYHCMMGKRMGTGEMLWSINSHALDPNEAVRIQVDEAERVLEIYNDMFTQAKEAMIPHVEP